jgi:hypothetical protein
MFGGYNGGACEQQQYELARTVARWIVYVIIYQPRIVSTTPLHKTKLGYIMPESSTAGQKRASEGSETKLIRCILTGIR